MSHLNSNEPCKGEKTQTYINNQAHRYYNNNIELYNRASHDRPYRESGLIKESSKERDSEQYRARNSDPHASEFSSRESMNPSVSTSHTAAVASAAAIYPRVASQQNRTGPPSHFESYGISSHLPSAPSPTSTGHHSSSSIHSSAHRHLLPPHHAQFNNSNAPPPPHIGLDMMWQQKVGPTPWMVPHYEDMRLGRERAFTQESNVREQERIERQKEENREKERHWEQQDRLDREERERVQREAVQQHFEESLRLALQKKNMGWNPSSSSKHSLNKTAENSSHMNMPVSQPTRVPEDRSKEQEKERSQYIDNAHARREHERWLAIVQQQRNEQSTNSAHLQNYSSIEARSSRDQVKAEAQQMHSQRSSSKQHLTSSPVNSSAVTMKNEVNFSLYGYQPVRQTYITPAQLKAREEKISAGMQPVKGSSSQHKNLAATKSEKEEYVERASASPNSSHVSMKQSKVMMSNHDRMYQPLVGTGGAFKPYEYSSNSNSPAPPAHQNTAPAVGRIGAPMYTQLQDQPQNLVKSDPKTVHDKIPSHKFERDLKMAATTTPGSLPAGYSPPYAVSKSTSPAANSTYSYSLIQQGLVPNPMYIASTHANSTTSTSTPPVSFTYSQSSKSNIHPSSPPFAQQYACASPNSGITSGSPVCRPSSVPYSLPPARTNRRYSPVGPLSSASVMGSNSKSLSAQDTQLSRNHISVQSSSHRSPSPARPFGQSNLGAPNSPHRSSPRITTVPNQTLSSVTSMPSSPYHSNSQTEVSDPSGIPLVKRKLLPEAASTKKRIKPSDDGLLPPQLQPQIQTLCRDTSESQIRTPPDLVSSAPLLGELNVESYSAKSSPSSPLTSSNLVFKMETAATPPSMPDLCNASQVENLESENSGQNFYVHSKFKAIKEKITNSLIEEVKGSMDNSVPNSVENSSISNNTESSEEQSTTTNTLTTLPTTNTTTTSSSSGHPKLKKAWLQRHSENEDKKFPLGNLLQNVVENSLKVKTENLNAESDNCSKSDSSKETFNPTELVQNDLVKNCDESSLEQASNQSCEINIEADEDLLSSESDSQSDTKSGKRKIKTNSKFLPVTFGLSVKKIKSENSSDPVIEEQNSLTKKEKDSKKESSVNSKKRGRKSKVRKGQLAKNATMKPPEKPSIQQLKKTGEPFLQDGSCCEVAPRLPKCRECRLTPHQRSKKMPNIFCRFYAYRKLRYGKNGTILSAGFSEPSDALEEDLKLWLPPSDSPPADIEIETSKFLLTYLGDQFCDLVEMEREAKKVHLETDETVTWKRVVQGVREMCDVCETTLFNIHWVCHKCGFVVCIDCYKSRKNGLPKEETTAKDRDDYQWLLCSNKQAHEQDKLMLTQIIPGTALWDVGKSLHDIRRKWNIPTYCSCGITTSEQDGKSSSNGINKLMSAVTKCFSSDKGSWDSYKSSDSQKSSKRSNKNSVNGVVKQEDGVGGYSSESGGSPLSWLADVALNSTKTDDQKEADDEDRSSEGHDSNPDVSVESDDDKNENFSTLRELLIRPTAKMGGKNNGSGSSAQKTLTSTLDEVISCVIEQKVRKSDKKFKEKELLHFTRRYQMSKSGRELPPVRTCILAESSLLYPEIPHLWLGNGKILLLKEPYHTGNMQMFQEQWKRGQPVIIADVGTRLDSTLWTPESFLKEFADAKTDFYNCVGNTLLQNHPLRKFWEGFENVNKRMKDEDGETMVLKLIDWPPAEEFSDTLPSRYDDLMKVLPLPQYTQRDGVLNMASRVPDCFVQPDLGPRMYNAYGISSSLGKGSTNLHLDVSDAINILAYVSTSDVKDEITTEIIKCLDESGCDSLMKKRAKERGSKPGALWHIYNARDADKIRDFLNKVSEEQGVKLNPHHDPIHNQEWYLDEKLRNRLCKEYGVEPYTITQCLGDAIFIPAGSPHQVLNFQSCVKVSEDFVSPESVGHSFFLTQEIRNLSDNVINSDDRLQIKNIIYHAVKDALALLQSHDPEDTKT